MKKKLLILGAIAFTILLVDQWLKLEVKANWDEMLSNRGLSPWENIKLIGDWFVLEYTENKGMAFGTQLGSGNTAKLTLSILRVLAVIGIAYLIVRMAKKGATWFLLLAMTLVWAGAFGNLLDSMYHDYIFTEVTHFDRYDDGTYRNRGFLFGNVVDMLQFDIDARYPTFMPFGIGGQNIFGFIFNIADAAISIGVVFLIFDSLFLESRRKKKLAQQEA